MKIKVSLTRQCEKLLIQAAKVTDDYSLIHFVYTDIDVNLKINLKKPVKNRVVFSCNSKTELAGIRGLIEHFEYHKKYGEAKKSLFNKYFQDNKLNIFKHWRE